MVVRKEMGCCYHRCSGEAERERCSHRESNTHTRTRPHLVRTKEMEGGHIEGKRLQHR